MMKTKMVIYLCVLGLLCSCSSSTPQPTSPQDRDEAAFEDQFNVPKGFDYETTKTYTLKFSFLSNTNEVIGDVPFEVHASNPSPDTLDTGIKVPVTTKLYADASASNGQTSIQCQLPSRETSLFLVTDFPGVPSITEVELTGKVVNFTIGGGRENKTLPIQKSLKLIEKNGFVYLDDYDSQGVPNELMSDSYDETFLRDVNASFPNGKPLYETHPDYFDTDRKAEISFVKDGELTITFVHESAGYLNSLGYFHYPTATPPSSISDIEKQIVLFPNVSFKDGGGGLHSGDKVQLQYRNQDGTYQNTFPAGTTIGWFVVANGWRGSSTLVEANGRNVWYSINEFNKESVPRKQKHVVTIKDDQRELLLIGFEDLDREKNSDEDFNDAIFYATPSSYDAVNTDSYEEVDANPQDSDGDGITDRYDDYPEDNTKGYDFYYPGDGEFNTLLFEDLWPSTGDYDFNDLVIDYNLHFVLTPDNELLSSEMIFKLRATGAGFSNGFGVAFPFSSSSVKSATGYSVNAEGFSLASNGVEAGQSEAVYLIFDNSYDILKFAGGEFVNTDVNSPYVTPVSMVIQTEFNPGVKRWVLGEKFFNPFLIQDGDRTVEVHLPGHEATSKADLSLYGESQDDSNGVLTYVTKNKLPWVLDVSNSVEYPIEQNKITSCYMNFVKWCNSGGVDMSDWMMNKSGYRNSSKIYNK